MIVSCELSVIVVIATFTFVVVVFIAFNVLTIVKAVDSIGVAEKLELVVSLGV